MDPVYRVPSNSYRVIRSEHRSIIIFFLFPLPPRQSVPRVRYRFKRCCDRFRDVRSYTPCVSVNGLHTGKKNIRCRSSTSAVSINNFSLRETRELHFTSLHFTSLRPAERGTPFSSALTRQNSPSTCSAAVPTPRWRNFEPP